MAVDEVLMHWAAATNRCCWRFYRWRAPTLSLGYFQAYEDRWQHAAGRDCPAVRRISGGGAILHDAELTYSFVLPRGHRLAARRSRLYETVHNSLIDVLCEYGIKAALYQGERYPHQKRRPFLCFQRRAPGDVLVGQTKVAGSAQRRTSHSVLQHGSVLLERSGAAPELDGLNNVVDTRVSEDRLIEGWLEKLGQRFALSWENGPLCDAERREAARLVERKFGAESWTRRRGP